MKVLGWVLSTWCPAEATFNVENSLGPDTRISWTLGHPCPFFARRLFKGGYTARLTSNRLLFWYEVLHFNFTRCYSKVPHCTARRCLVVSSMFQITVGRPSFYSKSIDLDAYLIWIPHTSKWRVSVEIGVCGESSRPICFPCPRALFLT